MSVPGASPALGDDPTVPRLVQVIIEPDGATISCFYCQRAAPIVAVEVDGQILRFQDAHSAAIPSSLAGPSRSRGQCRGRRVGT